jgi:hypothetical protein
MVGWCWSIYAWDFQRNRILVLDPLDMNIEKKELDEKHKSSITLMNNAMCECRNMFFPEQTNGEEEWETEYVSIMGGSCDRYVKPNIFTAK